MGELRVRADAAMPYQDWKPFPDGAIVKVWSYFSDVPPVIAQVKDLWWGYENEIGGVGEGVIARALRLDRPKSKSIEQRETDEWRDKQPK